ncbi:MAG TPA: glycosyltransferase family 87 protein [Candidatus Saccharimonadales bacterium]|nr:glycosyltransferase family 87 protein [Candidatus Saccharimonadales bacterium]
MKLLLKPFTFLQQQLQLLFREGTITEKCIFLFYFIASIALLLYSYTQVDLGLVITRVPSLYSVEKLFQYIGYFNRPLSAELFILLASTFLLLYFIVWKHLSQKKMHSYTVWSIIGVVSIILLFSYNAFSYDLFNYIFDAKIITHYHQNPYIHKALDYAQDPMLGFMHWTERTYPYGPLWLVITVPLSFIGANIFIVTFFLFKILMGASYLFAIYYLFKILKKVNETKAVENLAFIALNPLLLYECLISGHNDIVMMAFAIAALYYLMQKKYWISLLLLAISIGIKFATAALIPIFLLVLLQHEKWNLIKEKIYQLSFAFMLFPLLFVTLRTTFQPWYLLYVLPFVPFISNKYIRFSFIVIPSISIFLYIPFLATGDWHSIWYTFPEKIVYWIILGGVIGSAIYLLTIGTRMLHLRFRFAYNKQHA